MASVPYRQMQQSLDNQGDPEKLREYERRNRMEIIRAQQRAQARMSATEPDLAPVRISRFEGVQSRVMTAQSPSPQAKHRQNVPIEQRYAEQGAQRRQKAASEGIVRDRTEIAEIPHGVAALPREQQGARTTDFKRQNARAVMTKTARLEPVQEESAPDYGRVPEYLRQRQAELAAEKVATEERRREAAATAAVPAGLVRVPEEQRVQVLNELTQRQESLSAALARFPILCDTESLRRKKAAIESELSEVEAAIRQFSAKEVYIKK